MPSGSHGGSRGSHSSGGSSFGGSSSGGSSFGGSSRRGGFHHHHHGPHVVIFGRSYTIGKPMGGFAFILLVLIAFSFISMIGGFAIMPGEKKEIEKIKEDYYYYQGIIDMGHFTTAEVTDIFSNAGRYYITYSIDLPNSYLDLEGYSYSVYSRSEAMAILSRGTIQVALNKPLSQATLNTDSIPTDYKNMPLTNDGEYVSAQKGVRTAQIFAYVGLAVFVSSLVGLVVILKKYAQKEDNTPKAVPSTSGSDSTSTTQQLECPHCGCKVKQYQKTCSACGNKIK